MESCPILKQAKFFFFFFFECPRSTRQDNHYQYIRGLQEKEKIYKKGGCGEVQRTEVITTCWAPDIKPWMVGQVQSIGGSSFIVHRATSAHCQERGRGVFTVDRGTSAHCRRVLLIKSQMHAAGGCTLPWTKEQTLCRRVYLTMDKGTNTLQEGVPYHGQRNKHTAGGCTLPWTKEHSAGGCTLPWTKEQTLCRRVYLYRGQRNKHTLHEGVHYHGQRNTLQEGVPLPWTKEQTHSAGGCTLPWTKEHSAGGCTFTMDKGTLCRRVYLYHGQRNKHTLQEGVPLPWTKEQTHSAGGCTLPWTKEHSAGGCTFTMDKGTNTLCRRVYLYYGQGDECTRCRGVSSLWTREQVYIARGVPYHGLGDKHIHKCTWKRCSLPWTGEQAHIAGRCSLPWTGEQAHTTGRCSLPWTGEQAHTTERCSLPWTGTNTHCMKVFFTMDRGTSAHCRKVFLTVDRGTSAHLQEGVLYHGKGNKHTLQEGVLYCAQGDKRTQPECAFTVERVTNAHCRRV